jgi:hypothetical protein
MLTFSNMSIMFITTLQIRKANPQMEKTSRLVLNLSLIQAPKLNIQEKNVNK